MKENLFKESEGYVILGIKQNQVKVKSFVKNLNQTQISVMLTHLKIIMNRLEGIFERLVSIKEQNE